MNMRKIYCTLALLAIAFFPLTAQKSLAGSYDSHYNRFVFKDSRYSGNIIGYNLFLVYNHRTKEKALMDKTGRIKVPFGDYQQFINIGEGMFSFYKQPAASKPVEYGVIDTSGTVILKDKYTQIQSPKRNHLVCMEDKTYYLYNYKTKDFSKPLKYASVTTLNMEPYWMVVDSGKAGLIDSTGRLVLPCKYSLLQEAGAGNFRVYVGANYGLMDKNFKELIPPKYTQVYGFVNGYAQVQANGLWGAVDSTGKEVVAPKYSQAVNFQAHGFGTYYHTSGNAMGGYGLIDRSFKELTPPKYAMIYTQYPKEQGFMTYMYINNRYLYGILDTTGTEILAPIFESLSAWEGGYMLRQQGRIGYYNLQNKGFIPPMYSNLQKYGTDLFLVMNATSNYGLYNTKGEEVLPCEYAQIQLFLRDQYSTPHPNLVKVLQDSFMFFNTKTKQMLPQKYSNIAFMQPNCYLAETAQGKGCINWEAETILPCKYTTVHIYSKYITAVKNNLYGVWDIAGKEILPCKYDKVALPELSQGKIIVTEKDKTQEYNPETKTFKPQ
jgi:WG containing repeat